MFSSNTSAEEEPAHCDFDTAAVASLQSSRSQHTEDKLEHATRLQQYCQGVWELNFDFHAFQRWRRVGLAHGLTNDTEIACFLLLHFEKSDKNSGQPSSARCSTCHSQLSCSRCDPWTPSPGQSHTDQATKNKMKEVQGKKEKLQTQTERKESFVCSVCGTTFTRAASLKVHMRKHTGEKPYICKVCQARFAHAHSLSIHMRSHTGHRPFVCEQCGAAFAVRSVLKQHMVKHSGEKPYKCELCPSAFTQRTKLTIHMRKHTGTRPYQCEHCGAAFTDGTRLSIHLRCHTDHRPYRCPECDKSFTQSAHLTVHRRIHTGDKPFRCNICKAAFLDSTHLRRHERRHHAEEAYICRKCGTSYATASGLRMHERCHVKSDSCSETFTSNLKKHQVEDQRGHQELDS